MNKELFARVKIQWKEDKRICSDPIICHDIMDARSKVCDIVNNKVINMYNQIEDILGIDVLHERLLCDDVAYLTLFNTAWTCELIHRGYSIRVLDEYAIPKTTGIFNKKCYYEVVITIEKI